MKLPLSLLPLLASSLVRAAGLSSLEACSASMDGKLPSNPPSDFSYSGTVRRYYIAAEEIEWNYAPTGWDNWLGVPLKISPRAKQSTGHGTTYLKALYRGYTDASFTRLAEQPPWQGTQGPLIRSEVGDLIEIMFLNNLSSNYATMHSMGLAYSKTSEGADYPGNPAPGRNDSIPTSDAVPPVGVGIPPGNCVVYKWMANDEAGPNAGTVARAHSYHSYVDLDVDTNSGLIGPQVVYAPGKMQSTMSSYREFPVLYMIFDEYMSFLSGQNARMLNANHSADANPEYAGLNTNSLWSGNQSIWHPQVVNLNSSGQFGGASRFHSINGYIFANNPTFEMCKDEQVIWYAYGYGSASHVFHMHGNGVVDDARKQFAVSLNDGVSKTLYMTATGVGLWQLVCHVNNHQNMGMLANYKVYNTSDCGVTKY